MKNSSLYASTRKKSDFSSLTRVEVSLLWQRIRSLILISLKGLVCPYNHEFVKSQVMPRSSTRATSLLQDWLTWKAYSNEDGFKGTSKQQTIKLSTMKLTQASWMDVFAVTGYDLISALILWRSSGVWRHREATTSGEMGKYQAGFNRFKFNLAGCPAYTTTPTTNR